VPPSKQYTTGASFPVGSVPGQLPSIQHQRPPEPYITGGIFSPDSSIMGLKYVASINSDVTIHAVDSVSSTARKAFMVHEKLWSNLDLAKSLTWEVFPWPTLKTATIVDEITVHDIETYLNSLYQVPENSFGTMREYIVHNISRCDYNRMEARIFNRVTVAHQEKVKTDTVRVGRILQYILSRLQE
jgi:hypothetical protein